MRNGLGERLSRRKKFRGGAVVYAGKPSSGMLPLLLVKERSHPDRARHGRETFSNPPAATRRPPLEKGVSLFHSFFFLRREGRGEVSFCSPWPHLRSLPFPYGATVSARYRALPGDFSPAFWTISDVGFPFRL